MLLERGRFTHDPNSELFANASHSGDRTEVRHSHETSLTSMTDGRDLPHVPQMCTTSIPDQGQDADALGLLMLGSISGCEATRPSAPHINAELAVPRPREPP